MRQACSSGAWSARLQPTGWISFAGGELQGQRPEALCPSCRETLRARTRGGRGAPGADRDREGTLCFQCYRAGLDRERALRAAAALDTASEERFQTQLPFEPVDRSRLERLRLDRIGARQAARQGVGRDADRRRRAQIAARHALQSIAAGLRGRQLAAPELERELAIAVHAAELQLPEAWLPFVVGR